MKRTKLILASLAVALVLGMGIVPAWSYFTATSSANGGYLVNVKPTTDIREHVDPETGTKHVVITNAENASPVFVRVAVYTSLPTTKMEGTNWSAEDGALSNEAGAHGWFNYNAILEPGGETTEFVVDVDFKKVTDETTPVQDDNHNVVVLYESTPVLYDADGNAYADWSLKANQAPEGGK